MLLTSEKKEPTHSYKNLKTKKEYLFYFEKSPHPFIFYLITTEGENIGEWNKKSRMFYMKYGLSNYLIRKLDETNAQSTQSTEAKMLDNDSRWLSKMRDKKNS